MWYSVVINDINDKRGQFFKSCRGVKKGDLIFPTLFIRAAKVLPIMLIIFIMILDLLILTCTQMDLRLIIYHADNLIIFYKEKSQTLKLVMYYLEKFKQNSGQLIYIE